MASTWTLNNAVEKIADGEKTDTWGQITNRNFDILDRAAYGVVPAVIVNEVKFRSVIWADCNCAVLSCSR